MRTNWLLKYTFFSTFLIFATAACKSQTDQLQSTHNSKPTEEIALEIEVGANRTPAYLNKLKGKRVAVVANQTSVIFHNTRNARSPRVRGTHLVDSLLSLQVDIQKVFAPEHGFRGKADAGEHVEDGVDKKTGLPILSLHGKNRKPTTEQLANIDLLIFDIQDVGARFYTYISTMHYVMEACAEAQIPMMILDRPNPNGHYVDGPVLEPECKSFLGMHPVPIVHGMTIGEYAQMINGEGWLEGGIQCELTVIPVANYTHQTAYSLPIKPSPNLPNDKAINLYPSICFFEQTPVSLGRGTDTQFQVLGVKDYRDGTHRYSFTPMPNEGAKYPKHKGETLWGIDLRNTAHQSAINLEWLIEFYQKHQKYGVEEPFFWKYFYRLAGNKKLEAQIKSGHSAEAIKASWQDDLNAFKQTRNNYLIYP